ncbi:hypothetical protein DRN32_00730 [Thermococci archaeon]|nr:MAG: hypothetical protein DRN32_00730 [Thermococci archaeon]
MVNPDFWITIAQVSATFVGLVFVGLSIYLTSIRAAANEVEADLGMVEQSSRVMFVSVLSNLSFFVLPVIASLSLIAQQSRLDVPNLFWLSSVICLLLYCVLLWGHENNKTRQQVRLILSERAEGSKKLLHWRVEVGKWPLYLLVPIYIVLLAVILVGQPPILKAEDWLEGVTLFSIALGLSYGILDLILFDVKNILFRVSDRVRGYVERVQHDLQRQAQEVEQLYHEYETIIQSHDYQEELERLAHDPRIISMLSPTGVQEQVQAEQARIRSQYNRLREEIPADGEAKLVQQIKAKGQILTYAEIKMFREQTECLFRDISSYKDLLEDRLRSFEERGIQANGAG